MSADFDRELQSYFTDVEHLRDTFKQWMASPRLPKRLLIIHGVGGVGKSSLLRMFRLHCKGAHVPVALASGDEAKSALDVLTRWTEDLKADGVALPTFGKTYEHYRAIQAKVDEQAKKAQDARSRAADIVGKAASKTAEAAGGALAGAAIGSVIPGIGTAIGGALGGVLGGMSTEALVDWMRGFLTKPDIDLLLDPAKKLTDDFLADVVQAADKRRIVLMLDTFEQMTALDDWTRDVAQRVNSNLLLVIAGRALPNWSRAWPEWMATAQVEELKPMSEEVMRELIQRYYATMRGGQPNPTQVEAIIRFARGLPMVVTSAVQLWVKYGVEDFEAVKPEIVANLVDRLIEGVPKTLIPALEAAAIVRWFDQPILRAVTKQDDVREVYNELRRFPFVRPRAEGLALHDAVREIMDENLRAQDSERHCELHERAAAYFEKRLEKAAGEEAEKLQLERLYHCVLADEEAGIKLFQGRAEELVRYRLVDRLRALLKDMDTYPLEHGNSKLWREYYNARLAHLEGKLKDAIQSYTKLALEAQSEPKLYAYLLADLGEILSHIEYLTEPGGFERAIGVLEDSTRVAPVDTKTAQSWLSLSWAYRRFSKWEPALRYVDNALQFYVDLQDNYNLALCLVQKISLHAIRGEWREVIATKEKAISILGSLEEFKYAKARLLGRWSVEIWTGHWSVAEREFHESIGIMELIGDLELLDEASKRLGWVLGLQGRYDESQHWFSKSLALISELGRDTRRPTSVTLGFQGLVLLRSNVSEAKERLLSGLKLKEELKDYLGFQELYNGLGYAHQVEADMYRAETYYEESLKYKWTGRYYFECEALTGLVRVKHAQEEYLALPPLLVEAERLAQQYEYNDHLASLRLTQGHIAWDGHIPEWGKGFDAALHYYQLALIHALRYNRFLLDEVLSGRPQGTPLRPIIPECLKRGEEGRKMLMALLDWWKTGVNDIGTPRPDTISPIPEGIALLEAESIAREREPGNGLPQKSVVEQIENALKELGGG